LSNYHSRETISALENERKAALPMSPRPRPRRTSTGPISPALRPVLIDREEEAITIPTMDGPAMTAPHSNAPVDEVEFVFGE
jgi:hypothetical protein